ncbi:MAG TPA: hypothetical protein VIU61_03200 [Kofleriaceae bacterium]
MRKTIVFGVICLAFTACGFSGSGDDDDDGPLGGSLTVSGTVVDLESDAAVTGAASVTTAGLDPAPAVSAQGATFTIEGIPESSSFQILATVAPTHRATFTTVYVEASDLSGVKVPVVSETFLASLASGFGVTPSAARGVLLAQLVDDAGAPKAGVAGSNLVIAGADGPHFLDANMMPDDNANATSASGWVVFFELPVGVVELGTAAAPTVTLDMASSPVAAGSITMSKIKVTDGPPDLPTNVSFSLQIVPIFALPPAGRGCIGCHSGGGPGKDQGGLNLGGGVNLSYTELVEERPNTRVNLAMPELSKVLTMPSRESPPDPHPNTTFTSSTDPDYLKILVWIREGAKKN